MGKRELLLIVAFIVAGIVVYQVTAPPPAPGERSFSFRDLAENLRRAARGNRASAQVTSTTRFDVGKEVTDLRFKLSRGTITITGEDRPDIDCELHVQSNGYDEFEAVRLAKQTVVRASAAGSSFVGVVEFPVEGRQRATVHLKVPSRLAVRLEPNIGELTISNVAAVDLISARGNAGLSKVRGRVSATHVAGTLTITDAGSLKLNTRGSKVQIARIVRDVTLTARAGEVKGSAIGGPVEVDAAAADVTLEKLDEMTGMLRVTTVSGTLALRGVRTEGRIDARDTDVELGVEKAALLAVFGEGGGDVTLTPPAGGYQLDALTRGGRITLEEPALKAVTMEREQRASGAVRGGGATITIRTARGDITVKAPEGARPPR